jgi:hypothetical protein
MASRDCGMSAFDTIILLAGQREQPLLASILQNHNPLLTAHSVLTLSDVRALEPELLRRARLVAFTTDVIVPPDILDHLGFGAYNFHPGPPHFPGWAPALFAVHDHATEFGVTAHMMGRLSGSSSFAFHRTSISTVLRSWHAFVLRICSGGWRNCLRHKSNRFRNFRYDGVVKRILGATIPPCAASLQTPQR